MYTVSKYGKKMHIIYPGEFYVSKDDEIIATVLGSCISVCLYDESKKVSGMNHFMLPGKITSNTPEDERSAKYGITAIKELLVKMKEMGASKESMVAKIFGGGKVMELSRPDGHLSDDNIRIAKVLVELEDIPIVEEDIGGNFTRKVIMEAGSGKVFLKKTVKSDYDAVEKK